MTEERIERTFETGTTAEVEISNVVGTVEIQAWDRPEVQISAHKIGDNGDTSIEIGGEGTRAWARTRSAQGLRSFFGWRRRSGEEVTVDYTARVPYASTVSVSGVSGPIYVSGVNRAVEVHSVDGQITLEDLSGGISAHTVNSAIKGHRIDGALAIGTVAGRLQLFDSRLSSLRAESVDGSIEATGQIDNLLAEAVNGTVHLTSSLNPEGEYAVKTVNGSFHLAVPRDTACNVVASGVNVNVTCDLSHIVEDKRWGKWSGRVNDGNGAGVRFDTVNGTLKITGEEAPETATRGRVVEVAVEPTPATPVPEFEAVAAAEDMTPQPATPPLSKMDILLAVERGEIDVEEALERLRELD